jgi:hypothetical protein
LAAHGTKLKAHGKKRRKIFRMALVTVLGNFHFGPNTELEALEAICPHLSKASFLKPDMQLRINR